MYEVAEDGAPNTPPPDLFGVTGDCTEGGIFTAVGETEAGETQTCVFTNDYENGP